MRYFKEMTNRYNNCRYWDGSVLHAAFHSVFNPSHANKNLHPEEFQPLDYVEDW